MVDIYLKSHVIFSLYLSVLSRGVYRPIHKKFWVLWDFGDWIALSFVLFSCSLGFLNSKKFIWEGCEPVTHPRKYARGLVSSLADALQKHQF